MADVLLLQERVRNTIELGESHFREFKSALEGSTGHKRPRQAKSICCDIAESLVSFANADGGELLVGVEDDGTISGVPHSPDDVQKMLQAPRSHVHVDSQLPITVAAVLDIDGQTILLFTVLKGSTEIYQLPDGRCLRRKDTSSAPETVARILFDRQETRSRECDRQFVDGASVSDLDIPLLEGMAAEYFRGLSVERYLQQLGIAEYGPMGLRLRMAGLLLFAKDLQRWHPRSQVRILKVMGVALESGEAYNVTSDEIVQGNIFQLLVRSWEALRPHLAYRTEFGRDARFEQKYIYPEFACREALVNAIAHRDYTVHNGIDVFVFDDRMEIRNPGALLSTITLEDLESLQGAHESRNALVTRVLRENKVMRELGEGLKRVFGLMEENELERPKLTSDASTFTITLPHRSVFTPKQETFLSLFKDSGLTSRQKKIVAIGVDDRRLSPADIYKAMSTDDRDTYDREVTGLRNAGILQEIMKNPSAARFARAHNVPKAQVPRFKIKVPSEIPRSEPVGELKVAVRRFEEPEMISRTVFVANLARTATTEDLASALSSVGTVERVSLPSDPITGNKGFAFVRFATQAEAQQAILRLSGTQIHNRIISVRAYAPR